MRARAPEDAAPDEPQSARADGPRADLAAARLPFAPTRAHPRTRSRPPLVLQAGHVGEVVAADEHVARVDGLSEVDDGILTFVIVVVSRAHSTARSRSTSPEEFGDAVQLDLGGGRIASPLLPCSSPAVLFVVRCPPCRDADLLGDEEECALRDHLLAVHPQAVQPATLSVLLKHFAVTEPPRRQRRPRAARGARGRQPTPFRKITAGARPPVSQ